MILDDYKSGRLPKVDRFKKIIIKFVEFLGKYDFWKNPVLTGLNYIGTTQQLHCPLTQMARLVFSIFGLFKQ